MDCDSCTCSNPPAPTKKSFSVTTTLELFVLYVHETHECGRIRTASARRTVRRAKKPQWGFFRCAARDSTRAHQEVQHPNRVLDLLFCRNFFRAERADSNSCGAVAEDSAKTARWAVFSSAARNIHPRPPKIQYPNRVLDLLFCRNFFRAGREEGKCEKQSPVLAQARRVC